jgi:hypothetical protein
VTDDSPGTLRLHLEASSKGTRVLDGDGLYMADFPALPGAVLRGASAVRAGQRTPCGRCPGDGLRVLGAGPWGR